MRSWLGQINSSESLLGVYFDISEVVSGRDQSPFVPKQYGSITDLFLATSREGHVPSFLLCLFTSALAHGHSSICLDQRRWLPLCLNRYVP